jgi:hypothetical protein
MTSTKITVQTHSINHHRWLMWVAYGPAGGRADCSPAQPAESTLITRRHARTRAALHHLHPSLIEDAPL